VFFKLAAALGLERRVSKRAMSLCLPAPSKNWLKTKNMVEREFILLGTEIDGGIPSALLAREQNGELEFARAGDHRATITCQGRMDREVRSNVDRQAGAEGREEGSIGRSG